MITATVNGHRVEVEIVEAGGASGSSLGADEHALIAALDRALTHHRAFRDAYPGAQLTRVDINRMVGDAEEGRFHLRYCFDDGDAEFWGRRGERAAVDLEHGTVSVGP